MPKDGTTQAGSGINPLTSSANNHPMGTGILRAQSLGQLIEGFESGVLIGYVPVGLVTAGVTTAAAHEGFYGLEMQPGDGWIFRDDPGVHLEPGNTFSFWVHTNSSPSQRDYCGFGATNAGTYSLVLGLNTQEIIIQFNSSYGFLNLAVVPQSLFPNKWYRLEGVWAMGGFITFNLYDSDGTTLLRTLSTNDTSISGGGIAFRAFGSDASYFDEVTRLGACSPQNRAPAFTGATPACGSTLTVLVGNAIGFSVSAADPDTGSTVTLTASGLPAGSTMTPALPVSGVVATSSFSWAPGLLDVGVHTIGYSASDGCTLTVCPISINVITNRPPNCSLAVASEPVLWPPNHRYHAISILGVTDPDGDSVAITVTGIRQDEPTNTRGDGNTCPDAQIVDGQAAVRAERVGSPSAPGNGRVYSITFTADDGKGGQCTGTVNVCVPHDQGNPICADDGQFYNSLEDCRRGNVLAPEALSLNVGPVTELRAELSFALPEDSHVDISVFDVTGRRLATIEDAQLTSGVHERSWNMEGVAKGLYFVRMHVGAATLTRRVLKTR